MRLLLCMIYFPPWKNGSELVCISLIIMHVTTILLSHYLGKLETDVSGASTAIATPDPKALNAIQDLIKAKFKTLLKTRTLRGYPLNMSFTDVDEVTRKVCISSMDVFILMCVCSVNGFIDILYDTCLISNLSSYICR